jgi:hypothetical protein
MFHMSLLEPYRESGWTQPPPPPIEMEGALEYEVESILEHRFRGTRKPKAYLLRISTSPYPSRLSLRKDSLEG